MMKLNDYELVRAIRDGDPKERQQALDQLFPEDTVLMIIATEQGGDFSGTTKASARDLFPQLLFVAQQVGASLGLQLGWVKQQPKEDSIVIAQPGPALR